MQRFLLLIVTLLTATLASAQRNEAYLHYIETYKAMAVEQMQRHRIPASITLAQGLIESNAGRSRLAVEANNHFGIKVGTGWTGPYVVKSDDRPDDRFRKYRSAKESFEDHSLFLLKPRYSALFQLDPTDYRAWAYGLKEAGYATNPSYPQILINVIDTYALSAYDGATSPSAPQNASRYSHPPMLCNDVVYVVARRGDSYAVISREMHIRQRSLRSYNEVDSHREPFEGERVYLGKKKSHVENPLRRTFHVVRAGESMHSISQLYAVRLAQLYKWNRLPKDYRPIPGDRLKLK